MLQSLDHLCHFSNGRPCTIMGSKLDGSTIYNVGSTCTLKKVLEIDFDVV